MPSTSRTRRTKASPLNYPCILTAGKVIRLLTGPHVELHLIWQLLNNGGKHVAKFEKVPLEHVRLLGKVSPEKMKVIEEYKEYIEQLGEKEGGMLTLGEGKDTKEVRSDLKKAASLVGKELNIRISDNRVGFVVKESKKRGRPKGKKDKKEESSSEESS